MKHLAVTLLFLEQTLSLDPVVSRCHACEYCDWVAGAGTVCRWQAVDVLNGQCDSFESRSENSES